MDEIWVIILAAGESVRMKVPKMLLPFGGTTVIETVIRNALDSEADNIAVVLGSGKEDILKLIENMPVKCCINDNYKEGMLSSIKHGFSFLPVHFRAALVMPGDQPMVGPDVINMLISAYRASGKGIVIPAFSGKRGHPVLIDRKYRPEIEALRNGSTLRHLIHDHGFDILDIKIDTPDILNDIDTFDDYLKATGQTR
ncbi:MAG: nucleotidyltransferase family protein [Bacteroidales bacterium]|jgi:molybdenum cofactor cytidylyltransferase